LNLVKALLRKCQIKRQLFHKFTNEPETYLPENHNKCSQMILNHANHIELEKEIKSDEEWNRNDDVVG
jgi:hypothetical protein